MQVGILATLKSLFSLGSAERERELAEIQTEDHSYVRGNITERSPCPALNALANQGYLPRDGQDISLARVEAAMMVALHFDPMLTKATAGILKPLLREDGTFDLVDTRKHNAIEHDRSVTSLDFRQGDNYSFQPAMFKALLDDAAGGPVTVATLARTYNRRKRESEASGGHLPLDLWFTNLNQTVSFLNAAGTHGKLSKDVLNTFYTEERFPDAVLMDARTRTVWGLLGSSVSLLWHAAFV